MRSALPSFATALALAAASLAGTAAAQPVATAQGRGDELSTSEQIADWTHDAPPADGPVIRPSHSGLGGGLGERQGAGLGADSPWADGAAPPMLVIPYDAPPIARTLADGRIHGEVGAEYGNRGYGGYGVASGPLGDRGAVQIGVSDYQGTGSRRGGYGYGNGDRKSLSVVAAFDFSHDRKATPAPDTGAPPY